MGPPRQMSPALPRHTQAQKRSLKANRTKWCSRLGNVASRWLRSVAETEAPLAILDTHVALCEYLVNDGVCAACRYNSSCCYACHHGVGQTAAEHVVYLGLGAKLTSIYPARHAAGRPLYGFGPTAQTHLGLARYMGRRAFAEQ
jgi:hypothetical protein